MCGLRAGNELQRALEANKFAPATETRKVRSVHCAGPQRGRAGKEGEGDGGGEKEEEGEKERRKEKAKEKAKEKEKEKEKAKENEKENDISAWSHQDAL